MKNIRQAIIWIILALFVFDPMFSSGQVLNQRADSVYNAFNSAFLVEENNGNAFYKTALNNENKDYFWQQALDIQSAEDNYFRTGNETDKVLITKLLKTFNIQNTQDWLWNEYNDDIFWADLAFLRGFEYTGDSSFLEQGIYGFDLAYYHTGNGGDWGWDDALDGGLWWSKRKEAKETLSNGPGIVAACYLYQFTGDSYYLIKAKEIYEWLRATLRDENTGEVWNKINADGTVLKAVNIFNQGSFIGAANFLYQITGEARYLADAKKTADRVITNQSNNGILASGARGGTEMAEYFRWLGDFVRQNYLWNEYYSFLKLNADAAWSVRRRDLNITWNNFLQQMPEDDITGVNECNSAVVIHEVTPFLQTIADTIQAEDYNYKKGIYVDKIPSGGSCVVSIETGDWMEYILEIPTTGVYKINYSVAASNEGSAFLLQNGLSIDTISFPATGNLQTYATVSSNVKLTAGIQSIKIVADKGGWNIDKWSANIKETSLPGKIQAEDYDAMSGITVENTTDVGGGQSIGDMDNDDWLEYTIDVPKSGNYSINYRVAATQTGKILFQQNSETLAETTIPVTGGWQNWTTVRGTSVHLSEGTQTIKLYVQASGWNINWWSADLDSIPTISLVTPKVDTSYLFPATITIEADAFDPDGSISKVDFYQGETLVGTDNSSPYRLSLGNVQKGSYTFWAKATDNMGNSAKTEVVNVTVSNILPVVTLISPAIDSTFLNSEGNLTLEADATDEDGTINKVEFYNGATLLGTDYFAPYRFDWTGITPGTYWVSAKAIDSSGESATTGQVKISVPITAGGDKLELKSPDGSIEVAFSLNSGILNYVATRNSDMVIGQSALGIETTAADFCTGLTLNSISFSSEDETYQLPSGKQSTYINNYNQIDLVLSKGQSQFHVVFRAYNDGIAYKYVIPGAGTAVVIRETSNINVANFEKCWGQSYLEDYSTKYPERDWSATSAVGSFSAPVLCKSGDNFCLLTEAANYGNYCVSALNTGGGEGNFYFQKNGSISTVLPLNTPWRTAIIGSLPTITESVLVENLNPDSEIADVSWIKPGKASWDWGGQEAKSPWNTLEIAKSYVDLAYNMGWEYFMLDDGWESASYDLSEVIEYADTKGIAVLLWTNSNRFQNDSNQIRPILQEWKEMGFKGVKVDFWTGDQQSEIQKYDKVISIAADLQLLVNLHGCTNPSGTRRRWPNLLTSEAVYGGEQYMFVWDATKADHNINLVFTRNVVGPMDYTPTDFLWADNTLRTLTTWSHQLALATIYESGLQHFIDCPDSYLNNIVGSYLKDLPVTWDETKCLEGELNQFATLAHRKGDDWYIASLCNDARTLNLDLSFLDAGKTYYAQIYKDGITDFDILYEQVQVQKDGQLSVELRAHGGATVRISENPIDQPEFQSYEAEADVNTQNNTNITTDPNNRCSNNQLVGFIGQGNTLTFNNITMPAAGDYVIALYYMTGQTRDTYIKVNDQNEEYYTFPSSGGYSGNNLALRKYPVTLNAGPNTITFGNATGWGINIDKIIVSAATGVDNVGISEISSPVGNESLTSSETVTVKVSNESINELTNVPISYTINTSNAVNELIPSIPARSTIDYSFTQKADLSAENQIYTIEVKTDWADDVNAYDDTLSITINTISTGIHEVSNGGIVVYPTIVKDKIHVKFNGNYSHPEFYLINVLGQTVYQNTGVAAMQGVTFDLDVARIPGGMYVLKFNSSEGSFSEKIIKE